jgi:gliding motility-associated-like protein
MKGIIVLRMQGSCKKYHFINQYVIKLCTFICSIEVKAIMNNLKFYITLSLIFLTSICFSQNQNNIWYFGERAGVSFNTNPPSALDDGVFSHAEGVSSVCDINGDLLFFTNGMQVWNANREQMPNGFGLAGNNSSSQILILPKPGDCNIYYIFTTPAQNSDAAAYYSIIDMRLDNGTGDVITKNFLLTDLASERISATLQSNGVDYWVVLQEFGTNKFLSYAVTSSGVNNIPVVSSSGIPITQTNEVIGCMKFSANGKKICAATELGFSKCQLFDFDNQSGIVSNGFVVSDSAAYGVEFSIDGSKLYLSRYSKFKITQYDLSSNNPISIKNSETVLASSNTPFNDYGGALQLGPNNKIYIVRDTKRFLDVIENPNLLGISCNYITNSISLNGKSGFAGLPNFIKNYSGAFCGSLRATYTQSTLCGGNSVVITLLATYGSPPYQYSLDGIVFQGSNIFASLPADNYEITAKDANGLIRKTKVKIPKTISISLSIYNIIPPDCGFSNGSITLATTNGVPPYQYSKDGTNFQSSNIFSNLPASLINFTVRDMNGCLANKQINLTSLNRLKVFAGRDTGIFINQTIPLFAKDLTNSSFITYKWSPPEGLDNLSSQNPVATITKNIDYIVEATTALGCTVSDTIHIDVYKEIGIFVPSAFTPNNDSRNDILKAIPRGIKQLNLFNIYNRFGQIIFSSNNFSIGWDGKIKGINQNTSTYIWLAEGIDINGNIVYRKGSVSLIR